VAGRKNPFAVHVRKMHEDGAENGRVAQSSWFKRARRGMLRLGLTIETLHNITAVTIPQK
jgi:hypothetical protein